MDNCLESNTQDTYCTLLSSIALENKETSPVLCLPFSCLQIQIGDINGGELHKAQILPFSFFLLFVKSLNNHWKWCEWKLLNQTCFLVLLIPSVPLSFGDTGINTIEHRSSSIHGNFFHSCFPFISVLLLQATGCNPSNTVPYTWAKPHILSRKFLYSWISSSNWCFDLTPPM